MKILAFELSSPVRSVAAWDSASGNPPVCEEHAGGSHAPFFGLVRAVLERVGWSQSQVNRVGVGLGPGSYTGIRMSIAAAQAWQLGSGVETVGVGSLEAVALQAWQSGLRGKVRPIVDAQRLEYYHAAFELDAAGARLVEPVALCSQEELCRREWKTELPIGPEVTKWFPTGRTVVPSASAVAILSAAGRPVPAESLEPIYLRETAFVKQVKAGT